MTVVGGGAVGLCVAEALSARAVEVTVLEAGRIGGGASAGNQWVRNGPQKYWLGRQDSNLGMAESKARKSH